MAREVGPDAAGGSPAGRPSDAAVPAADPGEGGDVPGDVMVDDEALRPALELGFAVALVLSRQRPPQPVPAALKPFLRFQKLPTAALVPLRRVLATDEGFRARTAGVADEAIVGRLPWLWLARPDGWVEELCALTGGPGAGDDPPNGALQVGLVDGHHGEPLSGDTMSGGTDAAQEGDADAVPAPVRRPVKRASATVPATPGVTDRKLAKRLEAAEQALVRARFETDELRSEIAGLRARRDDDAVAVPKLTARATQLETELRGARRRVEDLQVALADAVDRAGRADALLVDTQAALTRAHADHEAAATRADEHEARFARLVARDAELGVAAPAAAPAPSGEPAHGASQMAVDRAVLGPEVRDVLREVSGATRRLGDVIDLLTEVMGRSGPAGSGPAGSSGPGSGGVGAGPSSASVRAGGPSDPMARPRRSRSHRRRPLPLPGGVLADSVLATEHLLRQSALVLVDGYNVAKLGWPAAELADQRARLLGMLEELEARFGADLRVVFDGSAVSGPAVTWGPRRRVRVSFSPPGVLADDVLVDLVRAEPIDRPVVVVTNDQELRARARELGANVVGSDQLLAAARR